MKMAISTQAQYIGAWLDEWVAPREGKTKVLANIRHLYEEVYGMATDQAPRVLICFMGADARGGFNERNTLDREDRQWSVVVLRGHGFKHPGVSEPTNGLPTAFYDDVEEIRGLCRRLTGISSEPIDYKGIRPLPGVAQPGTANIFLDGYSIEFSTATDIPAITATAPGQDPEP